MYPTSMNITNFILIFHTQITYLKISSIFHNNNHENTHI